MSSSLEQSVKARLKSIARKTDKDFNFVSIQFLQERFLARLEKSPYRENLVLKGALFLLIIFLRYDQAKILILKGRTPLMKLNK